MTHNRIRRYIDFLKRTPLHPQWLLGKRDRTIDWVNQHAKGHLLDIGASDRWIEPRLAGSVTYTALDYPATGQDLYKARPDLFGNASSLPFRNNSFDVVILFDVLEHLEKPREALEDIKRVLKTDGTLLLNLPFVYPIHDAPFDFQRYTYFGLKRELEISGFVVEELENTMSSSETAGLMVTLALGGAIHETVNKRTAAMLITPLLIGLIPLINLTAWCLARTLPNWDNLTAGLRTRARVRP